jgi:hypothetical protein
MSVGEGLSLRNSKFDLVAHIVSFRILPPRLGQAHRDSLDPFCGRAHGDQYLKPLFVIGETAMLRAAALFEAARPWAHKQPQIGDFR